MSAGRRQTLRLGVFHAGRRHGAVIEASPRDADWMRAYDLRDNVARQTGIPAEQFEVLGVCPRHPDTPSVDCLACDPEGTSS